MGLWNLYLVDYSGMVKTFPDTLRIHRKSSIFLEFEISFQTVYQLVIFNN